MSTGRFFAGDRRVAETGLRQYRANICEYVVCLKKATLFLGAASRQ